MNRKCIIIGVTGGIAAYKAATLVSSLKKKGHEVHVIMTKNATEFISPLTFETLSSNRVSIETFDRSFEYSVQHVSLAKKADVFAVVPATANVIAKIVHGIADDMLTTTFMACLCPKIICPAMNTGMLENEVTQNNLKRCKELGYHLVESDSGYLACGDIGKGRLADLYHIENAIDYALTQEKTLHGKNILITAGSTLEAIDPIRYIRNHSTGKMGFALAKQAKANGANVTLITGLTEIPDLFDVNTIHVKSAQEMFEAVKQNYSNADIIIKSAAVADYSPENYSQQKIKKSDNSLNLKLAKTQDILKWLAENKLPNQFLCGFAMETENLIENAKSKLINKSVDMIVANSLIQTGSGFAGDTNIATILTKEKTIEFNLMSKEDLSNEILKLIEKE